MSWCARCDRLVYLADIDGDAQYFSVKKSHLFSHFWGGLYAQIYAEKHPQRILSMFLCSPSSGTGELWKQTENEVMSFNKRHSDLWGWYVPKWSIALTT